MEKEIKVIEERETIITEENIDKNNTVDNVDNESREFYVYAHIRLDKMETFYIGKGKDERAYDLERNDHHDNISNMCGHAVLIIKDNLTEEEAFELERDTIEDYVFNLGYGIDIEGHSDYDHELPHLTNMDWGGKGGKSGINPFANKTEEEMETISNKISNSMKGKMVGEKNPMFGKNPYANKTPEEMEIIRRKMSESSKGKNKGINPYANKTPEEMEIISNKKSNSLKGKNKGKNPFANKTPEEMEIIRRNMSEKSKGKNKGKNPYANKTPEEMEIIGKNISEKVSGEKNGMWGKNPYANKTPEEMEIIGKKKSEKLSGEKNPMWGKPAPNRSKVICITTCKTFDCIKDAEKYYSCGGISKCCKGKLKIAGKLPDGTPLQWKYLKDYDNEFKGILINPITE